MHLFNAIHEQDGGEKTGTDGKTGTDKLDAILFSYRVSRQASTKYSPYFLMFGRHPRLPIDVEYEAANSLEDPDLVEPTEEDIEHALENLLSARMETKELASKNIKCAQQKQKEYYDRKRSPETFEEGTESYYCRVHTPATV